MPDNNQMLNISNSKYVRDYAMARKAYESRKSKYPGIESSKYHTLPKKHLKNDGFGGVLSFFVKGSEEQAAKVFDNLLIISHLANVGDAKTLIVHPFSNTHSQLSDNEKITSGVFPNLLRLSLGIEHIDDIKPDLRRSL